jgi:DNA polymerase III sliding clamp (beta) subunit (PCNA family)
MKLETIGKPVNYALRWLLRATAKEDSRPVLKCVQVDSKDTFAVTADGFRLHFIHLDDEDWDTFMPADLPEGKINVEKPGVNDYKVEVSESEINSPFPDVLEIVPRTEPTFVIGVNPRYLIDALSEMEPDKPVALAFHAPTSPFEVFGRLKGGKKYGGFKAYSVIMPMHLDNHAVPDDLMWKPDPKPAEVDDG